MTIEGASSDPLAFLMDRENDPALNKTYAITVPFIYDLARCECSSKTELKEPVDCKNCAPVKALSKLKAEAIKQTRKRWTWFTDARKRDDQLSTRLGTLGYLHSEIRIEIFRHVLEEYIEEALDYRTYDSPYRVEGLDPSASEWQAMKKKFREEFQIETYRHDDQVPELYKIFSLDSHPADHVESDFLMPLRLATIDTKFEFDYVFLSTMTFGFSCQTALRHFLKELSDTQRSQVRSITIELFACRKCSGDWEYKSWKRICDQLPSFLNSIKFEVLFKGPLWNWLEIKDDPDAWEGVRVHDHDERPYCVKRVKRAKELLEFLSCRVRHVALDSKVTMPRRPSNGKKTLDALEAIVNETDEWSVDYKQWKRRMNSEE